MRLKGLAALSAVCWCGCALGQLRIVDYNTSNDAGFTRTSQFGTIVAAISAESVNGIARTPDVFILEEQQFSSGTTSASTTAITSFLNGIYGAGAYASRVAPFDPSNDTVQTIIYKTSTVSVTAATAVGSTSTQNSKTAGARQDGKYVIQPVGYTSAAAIYVYAAHTKASQGTDSGGVASNAARRTAEAVAIRADIISNVPSGSNVMVAGDLNLYNPQEGFYTTITATGSGQMVDPLHLSTSWSGVLTAHTQSPATSSYYGGQVTGGMDDRFDFQLVSPALNDGNGTALIPGSYHAFGNNGTHQNNGAITTGTGAAANVLLAEAQFTDHIPVVADYQLPARMTVGTITASSVILKGTAATTSIGVTNSASVQTANGADELNYSVVASDALSGSTTGTVAALAGAQSKTLTLATSTVGAKTGSVTVTATSEQVPDAPVTRTLSYTVVDGSNASFSAVADQNARTLDFGVVRVGDAVSQPVGIYNLAAASGFTADLALTSVVRRQEFSGGITVNAGTFAALAAGATGTSFTASVDTSAAHTWDVSYQLLFADSAAVLGGTASQAALALNMSAKVVAFANGATPHSASPPAGLPVVGAITGAWSPTQMPSISFEDGAEEGTVTIAPESLFASLTVMDVSLEGDASALAAAYDDWTIDGRSHGYVVSYEADGELRVTFADPGNLSSGFEFSWDLAGTGASVAAVTVVPELGAVVPGGMLVVLGLLRRRRV